MRIAQEVLILRSTLQICVPSAQELISYTVLLLRCDTRHPRRFSKSPKVMVQIMKASPACALTVELCKRLNLIGVLSHCLLLTFRAT